MILKQINVILCVFPVHMGDRRGEPEAHRYGLNFTRGIFFECRHLSQTHSAYTSAVSNWKAGSVSPVQPLKNETCE